MALKNKLKRKLLSFISNRQNIFHKILIRTKSHANWLFGPISGEYCFPPEGVSFLLTHRCNLHCEMCYLRFNQENLNSYIENNKKQEININRWKEIVDELYPYKPSIGISGGEPLLYNGVLKIIQYIKKKGISCSVNTNGIMLEKFANDFVNSKLDLVKVSIDGPPEIHDEIRGAQGSYEKILKGIDSLNRFKAEKSSLLPYIEIFFTITNKNVNHLTAFLELIEKKNINSVKFIHPIFMSKNTIQECEIFLQKTLSLQNLGFLKGANIEGVLPNHEKLITEIQKVKKRKNKVLVWFFPDFNNEQIKEYYLNHYNFAFKFKNQCKVPWYSLYIDSDGSVECCPEFKIGNIREEKILSIWNNDKIKKLRQTIRKNGIIPLCHGCCNLYRNL